ncbi:MAG: hypothetical protein RMH77_01470 [Sulfolobales archaeon]|nr:hypothetical protein [Sulfolobales archaeon]MCX8186509.1 hypothetical protein [Sulfolobales archaeon]MDW7969057.1 hypothetical protein [Sulfolobales archaeon]
MVGKSAEGVHEALNNALVNYLDSIYSVSISESIGRLINFFRGGSDLLITYCGTYVSPANYLLLLLRSLTGINAYIVDPEAMTYYIAPYSEGGIRRVLIINTGLNSSAIRLLDQLNLTGYEVMFVSFSPLSEVVRSRVRDDMVVELPTGELLHQHLLVGMAVGEFLNRSGVRGYRLWYELSNLKPVVKDLVLGYVSKLLEVREFSKEQFMVVSTPSMLGPAEDITYNYNLPTPRYLIPLYNVKHFARYLRRVLLISTDVEEYSIKEIKGLKLTNTAEVCEMKVRTDPLTAPIYGLILSAALRKLGDLNV